MKSSRLLSFMAFLFIAALSGARESRADYVAKVWESMHPLSIFTTPTALKVDSRGNVYVTGAAYDSGAGTTVMYDSGGNSKWARVAGGMALAVDSVDNVYVTGTSGTVKYDASGNAVWTRDLQGLAIAVDAAQNAYVTGNFGTARIDPSGALLWTRPEGGSELMLGRDGVVYAAKAVSVATNVTGAVTYTMDENGSWATAAQYNGPADALSLGMSDIKLDAEGNTYAAGTVSKAAESYGDFITLKYDALGNVHWERVYGGAGSHDWGYALAVDAAGNVFMMGISSDFGWGTRIFKLDRNGNYQWVQYRSGYARSITVDDDGAVYFTTASRNIHKIHGNGAFAWSISTGFSERAARDTIAIDAEGNVYAVGWKYDAGNRQNYGTVKFSQASPNRAPVASAGPDQTVEITSCAGAAITLDGSGSSDLDGDGLIYTWAENGAAIASGVNPSVAMTYGPHTVTLTVDDGKGGTSADTVDISVVDTTPPALSASMTPNLLWPPNHKQVNVTPSVTVADACTDTTRVNIRSASSSEPDNGLGDGDTANDIVINSDGAISLRAERSGAGSGRVYTITYLATDIAGNVSTASAVVTVPHNK